MASFEVLARNNGYLDKYDTFKSNWFISTQLYLMHEAHVRIGRMPVQQTCAVARLKKS